MWKTKFGRCIYESSSGYKVHQNIFYRWLTLGSNALQTVINRKKPAQPVLYYLPALTLMARYYPNNACLLGLGGAGVALMLSELPSIEAIDNSEEVIDIAQRFFITKSLKNLTIIHDNAMNYVQHKNLSYSHLIIDLYNANHFPPECLNEQFFSFCKKIISEEGFLAINLANLKEQWPIFQLVKEQFNCTVVIPIKRSANMVIIAAKCNNKQLFIKKIEHCKEIKRITWVESWDYVGEI